MTDIFAGQISDIDDVSIDKPIETSEVRDCVYYSTSYRQAAEFAKANGDEAAVSVYELLSAVCSFFPKYDDQVQPYGPLAQINGRRSALPDDLTDTDLRALKVISTKTNDPSLKARILDVLWLKKKDTIACSQSVAEYLKAAEELDSKDNWVYAVKYRKRALQLSGKLGYDKNLYKETIGNVCEAIRTGNHGNTGFRTAQLMQVLQGFRGSGNHAEEFGALARSIAQQANKNSNPYLARAYWEIAADWFKTAGKQDEEREARIMVGECYVSEAEARMSNDSNGALAAAAMLRDGIEALRRAGADKERIQKLRENLSVIQEQSVKQMKPISAQVDISELVKRAKEHVHKDDFLTAILHFAFGRPLSKPDVVKKEVLELARKFPLSHLMSASQVDEKGRVIAIKGSMLSDKDVQETATEAEMFAHASKYHWSMRAVSFIEPGREQIENDHHPSFEDLFIIVRNNPFVPPGHEEIFLRGLYFGFNGDYVTSSHLLVPQIENSIRHVLETKGVDVSNLMSDGTQPLKILGSVLAMEETKAIFGSDMIFELRGLLIEKTGFDFRNRICHGFSSSIECNSAPGALVWWIVLRLCLSPIFNSMPKENRGPVTEDSPSP